MEKRVIFLWDNTFNTRETYFNQQKKTIYTQRPKSHKVILSQNSFKFKKIKNETILLQNKIFLIFFVL
jgi:hypothetical protein